MVEIGGGGFHLHKVADLDVPPRHLSLLIGGATVLHQSCCTTTRLRLPAAVLPNPEALHHEGSLRVGSVGFLEAAGVGVEQPEGETVPSAAVFNLQDSLHGHSGDADRPFIWVSL